MPQYRLNSHPSLPWTPGNVDNMNVSVVLDQPGNISFTNLDEISGRVVLRLPKELPVNDIIVKLEGESRTRLLSPAGPGEKAKPQLEYHKILYKVCMVFPKNETARNRQNVGFGKNAQTLAVGTHEFPWHFKLPFNNACVHDMTKSPTMNISGSGIEIAKSPTRHVKKTLPPTLSGFPGEAEIRYYVKVTVSRFFPWQQSLRTIVPFNFLPIEPPRPASSGTEIYARQTHSFNQIASAEKGKSKMKSFFASKSAEMSTSSTTNAQQSPTISVDARLPEPAILTCNEDIPLRLIVKKVNDFTGMVYLQSLQVALVGTTKIRAHEAYRTESNDWVIMSRSNLAIPLGAASDPVDKETVVDDHLWRGQALPNTVAPSFQTCNIERAYQLDVRVGLSYTDVTQSAAVPQTVVLPMRLNLEVYSGIAPPMELLEAMAEARASIRRRSTVDTGSTQDRKSSHISVTAGPMVPTAHEGAEGGPVREGSRMAQAHAQAPTYDDAPPSYEDAVATNVPPVDGSGRPEYAPPPPGEHDLMDVDEKGKLRNRRDS